MRRQIAKCTKAPLVATRPDVRQFYDFPDLPLDSIRHRRGGIFCCIAPARYPAYTIVNQGARVASRHFMSDHAVDGIQALQEFARECAALGAEWLVCTEKDRVKLSGALDLGLPVVWLKMKLIIVEGQAEWEAFVARAKKDLANRL